MDYQKSLFSTFLTSVSIFTFQAAILWGRGNILLRRAPFNYLYQLVVTIVGTIGIQLSQPLTRRTTIMAGEKRANMTELTLNERDPLSVQQYPSWSFHLHLVIINFVMEAHRLRGVHCNVRGFERSRWWNHHEQPHELPLSLPRHICNQ